KPSTPLEFMNTRHPLHRPVRKLHTDRLLICHFSSANFWLAQAVCCSLRFVRSKARDIPESCGSSLPWPPLWPRSHCLFSNATSVSTKLDGQIEDRGLISQVSN